MGCTDKNPVKKHANFNFEQSRYRKLIFPFTDSNTVLVVDMFDTQAHRNKKTANAIVRILKNNFTGIDSLACDSLWVGKDLLVDDAIDVFLDDVNHDGIPDVFICAGVDGRQNIGYHLFLTNKAKQSLSRFNGFEEIGNPEYDSTTGLISSCVLAGPSFCKFYFISSEGRLETLPEQFNFDPANYDSVAYENARLRAAKKLNSLKLSKSK